MEGFLSLTHLEKASSTCMVQIPVILFSSNQLMISAKETISAKVTQRA